MASLHSSTTRDIYPGPRLPSDDYIRVLILEPGEPGSPILCQLVATAIDSAPPYEALSYTWGDPEQCTTINVQDAGTDSYSRYVVTLNCFAALKRLRHKDRARTMWIDAICIDQSAVPERSHQVTLMSKIYSKATRVVVYLGEAEADSDLAMDYILDIDTAESDSSLTFSKSDTLANAVNNFFRRPWFNRVWVVQEIVFASHATVLCGSKSLSWSSIQNFDGWASWTAWIHALPYVVSVSASDDNDRDSVFSPGEPATVLEQLMRARHCRATDPRDKVYALLPFLRAKDLGVDIVPDYSKSTAQVFTECAAHLVAQNGLHVLSAVKTPPSDEALPSWAPDWSVPPLRSELQHYWWRLTTRSLAGDPRLHQARVLVDDGSTKVHGREGHVWKPNVLQAFGHCDGQITHIGTPYVAGQGPFPFFEWRNVFTTALGSRDPGPHERAAYSRIVGDQTFMRRFVDMEAEREADENLNDSWCQDVRKLADARKAENLPLAFTDIPFHLAAYGFIATAKGIVKETLQRCHNRRFFVTDTGMIGLGPAHMQLGDGLYRCFGADATFAFRDSGRMSGADSTRRVKLVGDCYVRSLAPSDDERSDDETVNEALECLHII